MGFETRDLEDWVVILITDRLDAFNCEALTELAKTLLERGQFKMAFDLAQTEFISIPGIKFLASLADEVVQRGGDFALLGPSEKIKRQIHIFATTHSMRLYRSEREWRSAVERAQGPRPPRPEE